MLIARYGNTGCVTVPDRLRCTAARNCRSACWIPFAGTWFTTSAASTEAEKWLSQFGTARVDLSLDDDFSLDESAIDVLLPLYDTRDHLWFTQLGYRHKDECNTVNMGLGFRTFQDAWMYGINSFWDNDMTGHNRRVGFGLEAWTDYLRLAANSYTGITDWHQSRDFEDYDERPADGFDIRAEAWLPAYPQLGGQTDVRTVQR